MDQFLTDKQRSNMKGKMDRQWTGSKMRKKIKGKGYPKVVPLTDMLPHSLTRSASYWLTLL